MKKLLFVLALIVFGAVFMVFFAARADALTAGDRFKEFAAAVERFNESITRSAPWDEIALDEALPMDPIDFLTYGYSPLYNLGKSKSKGSAEYEKNVSRWKNVEYEENGNKFRVICEDKTGGRDTYEGQYDQASGRMLCKYMSLNAGGEVYNEWELEFMKTDFGYAARLLHFMNRDFCDIFKMAIKGDEGIISWGETKFDTLYASLDFPKEGMMWYEISGDRFVFQPWGAPAREYSIKRK